LISSSPAPAAPRRAPVPSHPGPSPPPRAAGDRPYPSGWAEYLRRVVAGDDEGRARRSGPVLRQPSGAVPNVARRGRGTAVYAAVRSVREVGPPRTPGSPTERAPLGADPGTAGR